MGLGNGVSTNPENGQGERTIPLNTPLVGNKNNNNKKTIKGQFQSGQQNEKIIKFKSSPNSEKLIQIRFHHHGDRQGQAKPNQLNERATKCKPNQHSDRPVQSQSSQRCEGLGQPQSDHQGEEMVLTQPNQHGEKPFQSKSNQHRGRPIQCQSNERSEKLIHSKTVNHDEEPTNYLPGQHPDKQTQHPAIKPTGTQPPKRLDTNVTLKMEELDPRNGSNLNIKNKPTEIPSSSVRPLHGRDQEGSAFKSQSESTASNVTAGSKKEVFQFWAAKNKSNVNFEAKKLRTNSSSDHATSSNMMADSKDTPGNHGGVVYVDNDPAKPGKGMKRKELFSLYTFTHVDHHVLTMSETMTSDYSMQEIVSKITEKSRNDLEKIRAIWIWLCHNISYDVGGFLGQSPKIFQPEDVLKSRKAVCSGYASLLKDMCGLIGIKCREVSGYSRGTEHSEGLSFHRTKSNHMWNALEFDGRWHLLDACWGAGTVDFQKRIFIPSYEDFYFLTDPEDFIETHWPDDPAWQLLEYKVSFETFEQKIFKTSEFFKLGLFVISPKVFYLKTDRGEVNIMLGCPQPTEFSYKIYKTSNNDRSPVEKTYGMLTMHESSMTLKVMPPTDGLFELMIFARPMDGNDIYRWVCSYQIDCPDPQGSDWLPKNPFHFWGVHQKAKYFGVSSCSHGGDLIVAENGALSLVFETSRPLLAMYELAHNKLAEPLSKKCLVSHIEETRLGCRLLLPYHGFYRLSLFVKDPDGEHFQNAANLLIQCTHPINHNELFPPNLSIHCGPGLNSKLKGLTDPSHLSPVITTTNGKCNITFHALPTTEVFAVLEKTKRKTSSYSLDRCSAPGDTAVYYCIQESGCFRKKVGRLLGLKSPGPARSSQLVR
ncbi:lim and transglutaminase domain protein ltd-1-like isoform X2 [Spea bombifrons]|uniref:lim and transglutaminase domain protein ltd-1-like isoform X2 n=1 Tax=Spea bombifrons TaxID=233779 RepID=UPI00234B2B1D|nr:lim and transglutaminase domain protein ltd-1-like isoform X2 [Spea bombifrons]